MKTLLQILGLRSSCCNAKIITWHHDKHYCEHCERWLDRNADTAPLPRKDAEPAVRTRTTG